MIRKFVKKNTASDKMNSFISKYKIPRAYLSINRRSVSSAIFIGLFIAMIPMPMQMLAVLFFIPFIKFNVPLAITLVWITNPFTMPFIYYIEYITGNFLTMGEGIQDIQITVKWFSDNFDNILIPLYVGAFFYSTLLAFIGYFLVNYLWMYSVCKENRSKGKISLKEKFRNKNC